ncbi:MAG: head-tail connector protein [Rhizobiaceae bacterium]|nr:head-tail connector protein [Rhizobiaceae bacterium]MCV0406329.1 head-tail connector protein [Rhizobiaceae bacterium]
MHAPVRTSPPAETPVSLTEVKAHCRVDHDDDDAVLTALLNAAVSHLDGWTGILGRAMVTQSWRQEFAGFGCLRLPVGPVASIASITYYDADNEQQTLADSLYVLRHNALGAYVDLKPDQNWPGTYPRVDAVSVTYVAGTVAADVPAALKAAIMLLVSHWNEHREAVTEGAMTELPMAVNALIAPYRRMNL